MLNGALALLPALWLATAPGANHRVLMVVPSPTAAQAGDSIDLETRLGHSADVTLISYRAQLEISDGARLGSPPGGPGSREFVDTKEWHAPEALQMGRFGGADAVVFGPMEALQLCVLKSDACKPVSAKDAAGAAAEILKTVGAATPSGSAFPDETQSAAARAAYARCKGTVSAALQRTAPRSHKSLKVLDKDCQAALAADPKYLPAQAAHAAALELGGDAKAQGALEAALKKLPGDSLVPAALADFHRLHPAVEVTPALQEAQAGAPASVDLPQALGEMSMVSDDRAGAVAGFEKALQLAPSSAYLHERLAYAAYVNEDVKKALDHAEQASKLSRGEHDLIQAEYASRLIDASQFAKAQAVLEPLRKADPTWGRVALRLGFALHKQGKSKDALPHLQAALAADPRPGREQYDRELAEMDIARVHAVLGERDAAFQALTDLQKKGKLEPIALQDPDFKSLRADPRFVKLAGTPEEGR